MRGGEPPEDVSFFIEVALHVGTCDKARKQGAEHGSHEHHPGAVESGARAQIDQGFFDRQKHEQAQADQKVPSELANLLMDNPGYPHRYLRMLTYL